ncbi:MAG: hypothetical protein HKO53_15380, partial [Gemmatimonadetes bacterium]|nr:hypothetical protein [Gemmatimonadota bacterium]
LWLAMEVVAAIVAASEPPPKEEGQDQGDGEGGEPPPQPPQGEPQQMEASDVQEGSGSGEGQVSDKPLLYKKGDRAVLKAGPHKGRTVEVTRASLPHPETGVQRLEFALVEED